MTETSTANVQGGQHDAVGVGDWVLIRDNTQVTAVRVHSLDEVALEGELSGVIDGSPRALLSLKGLGALNPLAAELYQALETAPRSPLTYNSILGSGGWELLFLELTGQCNEACSHCYAESSPERKEKLSQEEVLRVIRQAHELGFAGLQLTGGDPLVSSTYLKGARLAADLGFERLEVFTNGLALSDRVADELAECGVDFAFSFYSHREDVHDEITGTPGSQKRTLAAIQRALDRKLNVRVGYISMGANRDDAAGTATLLRDIGVPAERIGMEQERSVGRGEFANAALAYEALEHEGVTTDSAAGQDRNVPSVHGGMKLGGKLAVSYSGDVYPCIFSRHRSLGSIRDSSLQQLLKEELRMFPRKPRSLPTVSTEHEKLACMDCQTRDRLLARFTPQA